MIDGTPVYIAQPSPEVLRCTPGSEEVVADYLGLNHDMERITAGFPAGDAVLERAVNWCPGLRLLRQPRWECLATFITSSLKQVAHIRMMSLKLRERFGESICAPGLPEMFRYPAPEAIARAGETALRECGLGYRAAFLHRAAREITEGRIDLESVATLSDAASLEALCGLHGVGEKIASCALLFAWDRHGAFPIDVWIERALRELYFARRRNVTPRRIREFAWKHFGPARGYAQQFLFHWARLTDCGRRSAPEVK